MNKFVGSPRRVLADIRKNFRDSELRGLLFFAVIILVGGTIFYMAVEGWDTIEAFYFCVTVLTTVGFGDLHPTSDASRLFTSVYMLLGIGFVLGFINVAARQTAARIANRNRSENEK